MTDIWREDDTASLRRKAAVGLPRAWRRTDRARCGIHAHAAERSGEARNRARSGIGWIKGESDVADGRDVLDPVLHKIDPEGRCPGVGYLDRTAKLLPRGEGHRRVDVYGVPADDVTADLLNVDRILCPCWRNACNAEQDHTQYGGTGKQSEFVASHRCHPSHFRIIVCQTCVCHTKTSGRYVYHTSDYAGQVKFHGLGVSP